MNPPTPPPHSPSNAVIPDGHLRSAHAKRSLGRKAKNNLVALGSAAVLAVYFAGYYRTRAAAQRFEGEAGGRRPTVSPAVIATAPAEVGKSVAPVAVATVMSSPPVLPAASAATTSAPTVAAVNLDPAPATVPVAPPPQAVAAAPSLPESVPPPTPAPAVAIASTTPVAPATSASVVAAPASTSPTPVAAAVAVQTKWKDGTFSGWGSCRHGDIEATIEIKDGRIVSAIVSSCQTRYSCDVIAKIIPQVVARQSADVDTVSGATQSADAFYWAVTQALGNAKPVPAKAS